MVRISEKFFVSAYGYKELAGGTEIIGEQYCDALGLKYLSAKMALSISNGEYINLKDFDTWLCSIPHIDLLVRNSMIGTTFDYKKPNVDLDIVVCFEHFEKEGKCNFGDSEWTYQRNNMFAKQKTSVGCADKIVVLSKIEGGLFEESGFNGINVIEPYVNTEIFKPINKTECRKQLNLPLDKKIALFVGRAHGRKGWDTVQIAGDEFKDVCFVNVFAHDVQTISDVPSNVKMVGNVEQRNMNLYYNSADVLFMPTRYESFGMIFSEAMCCGLPIVGYGTGLLGIPGELDDYAYIQHGEYLQTELLDLLKTALKGNTKKNTVDYARTRFSKSLFKEKCAELIK